MRLPLTLFDRKLRSISVKTFPLLVALFVGQLSFGQGVQIEKAPGAAQSSVRASPARPPQPAKPAATPSPAEALYDYLQQHRIEVAKDQAGTRLVWTDRIMIEITDAPPPEPLATLLSAAPANNGQFAKWVHDTFEVQTNTWRSGKRNLHPSKAGTDELVGDAGTDHCFINPVYLAYVLSRYPNANILIKGPTEPALFTVNGQLRAVVSPWTKLPDGTPLL